MSAEPRRFGVVGDPIQHSLSPVLHRAGYDALGLHASYHPTRVPAGTLAAHVAGLDPSWCGLSVTAPLKREALDLATRATDRAVIAGGANTLQRAEGPSTGWIADNTDLPGAIAAIRERYDGPVASGLVLGAGATAASVGLALIELGATRLVLAAREPSRAAETVAALGRHPAGAAVEVVELASYTSDPGARPAADVVVSTIPAHAQSPELCAAVTDVPVLFEVLYDPWPTPLAATHPGVVIGGLDLLVHQAVLQFQMFTQMPAPLEAMRSAGRNALAGRRQDA